MKVTRRRESANNLVTGWRNAGDGDYIATITPQEDGNLTFRLPEGVAHATDDGEQNATVRYLVIVELDDPLPTDETPPYVRIDVPSGEQTDIFTVEIIFSEPVTGFTRGDLAIRWIFSGDFKDGGEPTGPPVEVVGWETTDNKRYTARIAPLTAPAWRDGRIYDKYTVIFKVKEGVARDAANNKNESSGEKLVTVIRPAPPPDFTAPVVTVSLRDSGGDFALFSIEFSEEISSFTQNDVRITGSANPTTTEFEELNSRHYRVSLLGGNSGTITVTVPANTVRDAAGNGNAETSHTYTVPSSVDRAPTVSITVPGGILQRGLFEVRFEFSEDVDGLDFFDTVASYTADGVISTVLDGPAVYVYTITPTRSGFFTFQVISRWTESIVEGIPVLYSQPLTVFVWPEDVNGDNVVDFDDLYEVASRFGESPGKYSSNNPDVNRDGTVDMTDFDLILDHYGTDIGN